LIFQTLQLAGGGGGAPKCVSVMHSLSKSAVLFGILALAVGGCDSGTSRFTALTPTGDPPQTNQQIRSWISPQASSEDLLYISDPGEGGIEIRSYTPPKYRLLGLISLSSPDGYPSLCVNKAQEIFATNGATVFQYKRGATSPFRILGGLRGPTYGCAVDPTSGTLAVTNGFGSPWIAEVTFFKKGRGRQTSIQLPSTYSGAGRCAYDGNGNLFVESHVPGSIPRFALLELPKNKKQFVEITLNETFSEFGSGGGILWDGSYLDIADFEQNVIYQFAIAGKKGTAINTIVPQRSYNMQSFFVEGSTLIVPAFSTPEPHSPDGPALVNFYNYPAGGKKTGVIRGVSYPWSVVVSLAKTKVRRRTNASL
jgi:hypothetical protein